MRRVAGLLSAFVTTVITIAVPVFGPTEPTNVPTAEYHGEGQVLLYDPRGDGQIAEVVGDLATADRIAVLVPGVDVTLANFHNGLGSVPRRAPAWQAARLYEAATQARPDGRMAIVAWLGYDPPEGIGVPAVREDRAAAGAAALNRFLASLLADRPQATVMLVGHSYGSTVLGRAAPRLDPRVTDLVALGSPGMGVRRAADLRTSARIWAGTASGDWTARLPSLRVGGAGHGTRPAEPAFGAHPLPVGGVVGHDGYFVPGTASLRAMAELLAEPLKRATAPPLTRASEALSGVAGWAVTRSPTAGSAVQAGVAAPRVWSRAASGPAGSGR